MGLLLLIPTAVVIIMAIKGRGIYVSLTTGILLAILIGMAAGLFSFSDLIAIKDGAVVGAIPEGVSGMTTVCILLIILVSMGNILVKAVVCKLPLTGSTKK